MYELNIVRFVWDVTDDSGVLAHLLLYKMAAILADDVLRRSFVNEKFYILIKIHWTWKKTSLFLRFQPSVG